MFGLKMNPKQVTLYDQNHYRGSVEGLILVWFCRRHFETLFIWFGVRIGACKLTKDCSKTQAIKKCCKYLQFFWFRNFPITPRKLDHLWKVEFEEQYFLLNFSCKKRRLNKTDKIRQNYTFFFYLKIRDFNKLSIQ